MPDGSGLVFPSDRSGSTGLRLLRVREGISISLHPDGKRIAFVGGGERNELWMISGLLRDQTRRDKVGK